MDKINSIVSVELKIICPICSGSNIKRIKVDRSEFEVFKCVLCGLIWIPNISQKVLDDFYQKNYFEAINSDFGYNNYLEDEIIIRLNAQSIINHLPHPNDGQTLLDIGCAYGFMLDEFRKKGWKIYGVESSEHATKFARQLLDLNGEHSCISQGNVFDAKYPNNYFDVVALIGTIEHLKDPIRTLREIYRILKHGGSIVITTINTKGLVPLFTIKPPEHLFYFSAHNITLLLDTLHFQVIKIENYWVYYTLNEALCRAWRLILRTKVRIEEKLKKVSFLKHYFKIPTNEMYIIARKK